MALVQDNEVYHYHLDHLGTPRELTNHAGDIVWKVRYRTWGNVALKECEEIENNIRFQGQYFDEETGLHYNRHRYYNPDTGQFISQDPIGLLGGVNNYQYAPNPLGWIDPFGLCKEYETTPLISDYIGENDSNNLNRWNIMFGDDITCKYLDETERETFEVAVTNGKLAYLSGANKGKLIDTSNMASLHSNNAAAIFVMDPQGRIYLGSHGSPGDFHHSSFLAGAPVSSAGEMTVKRGKIIMISNESGHYKPKQSLNNQVFEELQKKGMPESDVNDILRSGVNDVGMKITSEKQRTFERKSDKNNIYIPGDWMDT